MRKHGAITRHKVELSRIMGSVTSLVGREYGLDYKYNVWIPAYENAESIDDLPAGVRKVLEEMLRRQAHARG